MSSSQSLPLSRLLFKYLSMYRAQASFAGNMGMYMAEVFEDSWQVAGMADAGMAPSLLARRSDAFGTPIYAVLLNWFCVIVLVYFDFGDNLAINNFFSCLSVMLEICAFAYFRWKRSELQRPYRIPLSDTFCIAMTVIPLGLGTLVLFSGVFHSWYVFLLVCALYKCDKGISLTICTHTQGFACDVRRCTFIRGSSLRHSSRERHDRVHVFIRIKKTQVCWRERGMQRGDEGN